MFNLEPYIRLARKNINSKNASVSNSELLARRAAANAGIERHKKAARRTNRTETQTTYNIRRGIALMGIATALMVIVDKVDTTSKEAASSTLEDIKSNADPKQIKMLRGVVILSSGQDDSLSIRPNIGTGTYQADSVKNIIPHNESVEVTNPILVVDKNDGDVKMIVQSGESADSGYGVVTVDYRTDSNIDTSAVQKEVPIDAHSLLATDKGTIVAPNLPPIGLINR